MGARTAPPSSDESGRVLPARQLRSEQTRDRLLQTGSELLSRGGFNDVSIAQIAARSGCSVGAFYMRFRNKKAYFEFLLESIIEQATRETATTLTAGSLRGMPLAERVRACVRHYIQVMRKHEGLLRAAMEYSINGSADWQPVRDAGAWFTHHYSDLILARCRSAKCEQQRAQLNIGLQVISGYLLNAISHKPTAMPLGSPELEHWLSSIVLHCLKAPPPSLHPQQQQLTP